MSASSPSSETPARPLPSWYQPRIWHYLVLVVFVALAIADIQAHRVREPFLFALALAGFVAYAILAWLGWWAARRRLEPRLGPVRAFAIYAVAMGVLFLAATVIYLVIEYAYRNR